MSKNNLNECREDIGAAAAMIFGALTAVARVAEPEHTDRIEICLNVRQLMGNWYSRWECRWMGIDDKLHTATGPLMAKEQPPIAYYIMLQDLRKTVAATMEKIKQEKNGEGSGT